MLRSFLQVLLDSEGYRVSEAEDGEEMFQILGEDAPDLIVLDIMLPDGNGVDFARRLRRNSLTPIVFATAVTDTETRRRAFGLMNVDYVNKPFDAKELLRRVGSIIRGAPVVMENPHEKDRPKPPAADVQPWYRAPLIWGPALAFLIVVVAGAFLLPKDEDPMQPRARAIATAASPGAAAPGKAAPTTGETIIPGSGIIMKDAEPAGTTGAGGTASAAVSTAAGGTGVAAPGDPVAETPIEAKIAQACGELPISEHFNNNSIPRILRYVKFVHRGDWGEYLSSWEQRLKNVQDLESSGKTIELQNKGQVLSGKQLTDYLALMERRVRYLRCAQQIAVTAK